MLLAIDQGTTSSRALVYDPTSFAILGSAQQELEQHYPHDGWVEHEPEDIWYSTARTVRGKTPWCGDPATRWRGAPAGPKRDPTAASFHADW